jgi:Mrp family chromosome partitioning ATPase
MLSSERMKELFEEARNIFDMVLIDSPPVSAVTDPVLLASLVKNVMLVVRYGVADKKAVENAKQMMERTRARVHGAVLNGAMFTKAYGKQYRYAYYYDSSYYHSDKK